MKKIITEFFIMFTIILVLFKLNIKIKKDIYSTSIYFLKNVLPTLYPIMIISMYLKYNVLTKTKNKIIYFLTSLITFAPSNALLSSDKKLIFYSTIINPFYSYSIIANIYNKIIALKIIITNIIINNIFVLIRIYKSNNNIIVPSNNQDYSLTKIIKISIGNIVNIFGITMFFSIVNNILHFIKIPKTIIVFTDIINGFRIINDLKYFKLPLIILLNSFTGISILFQIKSINENFEYKFIFYKFILSLLSLILTLLIIYL